MRRLSPRRIVEPFNRDTVSTTRGEYDFIRCLHDLSWGGPDAWCIVMSRTANYEKYIFVVKEISQLNTFMPQLISTQAT